jgi:hypothetical protein
LEHPRQRRCSYGPLEPVAEEGRGENEVMQPVENHVWFEDRWMVASWCDE